MNYTVRPPWQENYQSDGELLVFWKSIPVKLFRGTIDFLRGCSGAKGDEREDILMLGDDLVNQTIPADPVPGRGCGRKPRSQHGQAG